MGYSEYFARQREKRAKEEQIKQAALNKAAVNNTKVPLSAVLSLPAEIDVTSKTDDTSIKPYVIEPLTENFENIKVHTQDFEKFPGLIDNVLKVSKVLFDFENQYKLPHVWYGAIQVWSADHFEVMSLSTTNEPYYYIGAVCDNGTVTIRKY